MSMTETGLNPRPAAEMTGSEISIKFLFKFCSTDPTRSYLHNPWNSGGYTWATDGRVLIRIPEVEGFYGTSQAEAFMKTVHRVFASPHKELPTTIPDCLPPLAGDKKCEHCNGTGKCRCAKCRLDEWDGVCAECDNGVYLAPGTGVAIGNQVVSSLYLHKLKLFPLVKLFEGPGELECLHFTFTGGEGKLMPMRKT